MAYSISALSTTTPALVDSTNAWGSGLTARTPRNCTCDGYRRVLHVSELQVFDVKTRIEAPLHGGEVAVLRGFLGYQRDTLRWKCSGLGHRQLAQSLPPSPMTLGGLMKHLTLVESQWFDYWFRGLDFAPPFDTIVSFFPEKVRRYSCRQAGVHALRRLGRVLVVRAGPQLTVRRVGRVERKRTARSEGDGRLTQVVRSTSCPPAPSPCAHQRRRSPRPLALDNGTAGRNTEQAVTTASCPPSLG
jgi:Protein of unknown function (DUF664).